MKAFASVIPCNHISVLDCFTEGNFDWSEELITILPSLLKDKTIGGVLRDNYGVVGYNDLPSIKDTPSSTLHTAVTNGCTGYARNS